MRKEFRNSCQTNNNHKPLMVKDETFILVLASCNRAPYFKKYAGGQVKIVRERL